MLAFDLGEYFTESNLRWFVIGAGSGALAAGLVDLLRRRPGWLVGVVAPVVAFFASGWLDWPDPQLSWVVAVVVVGLVAGHGFEQVRSAGPGFVPPLLLLGCAAGVWLAVPENDPALVVAGAVVGLAVVRRTGDPGIGWGLCLALAWSAALGARVTGWSFVGGLLSLAPLVAVGVRSWLPGLRHRRGVLPTWPWLVISGGAVSFAAARWVGVAPDATWSRVALVSVGAGAAVAVWRH